MKNSNILIILAVLGAALIAALGTAIPLPPIVTGEESVRADLVKSRVDAVGERYRFEQAALDYQKFLATHDVPGGLPSTMRGLADELEAGANPITVTAQIKPQAELAMGLGEAMYPYAQTSESYFKSLRGYEDDLMSWSRTLGPRSEELRKATWPFIAWTSLYPEPVGTRSDLHFVPAADVRMAVENLRVTVAQMEQNVTSAAIRRVALAAGPLWDAGHDLPQYATTHDGYFSALRQYDDQSVTVAATPDTGLAGVSNILAWVGTVFIALLLLAGLLLLFAPGRLWQALRLRRSPA